MSDPVGTVIEHAEDELQALQDEKKRADETANDIKNRIDKKYEALEDLRSRQNKVSEERQQLRREIKEHKQVVDKLKDMEEDDQCTT